MESEEQFKKTFGKQLCEARKNCGYTQLQLAEAMNYTDKAVSKWERGESVPDTYTVLRIAEYLQVSPSFLFGKENETKNENTVTFKKKSHPIKLFVPIISSVSVFFIASVLFLVFKLFEATSSFAPYIFLVALPVMFIELVVFSFIWWKNPEQFGCISCLIWSVGGTAYGLVRMFTGLSDFKYIFICCGILQAICILVFIFVRLIKKYKHNTNNS